MDSSLSVLFLLLFGNPNNNVRSSPGEGADTAASAQPHNKMTELRCRQHVAVYILWVLVWALAVGREGS